jgi:hypothetical protein
MKDYVQKMVVNILPYLFVWICGLFNQQPLIMKMNVIVEMVEYGMQNMKNVFLVSRDIISGWM